MNNTQVVFGVLDPVALVARAQNLNAAHASPASMVLAKRRGGVLGSPEAVGSAAGLAVVGGIVLAVIAFRAAAGWYIGKQFNRPKSGAAVGAFFGAPGMGVLSLFPGDK